MEKPAMKIARVFSLFLLLAAISTSQQAAAQNPLAEQIMAPAPQGVTSDVVTPSVPGGPMAQPEAQQAPQPTAPAPDQGIVMPAPGGTIIILPQGHPALGAQAQGEIPPAALEGLYRRVWDKIGATFYKPEALANWATWEHKYHGKLKTIEDMDKAIKEMVASLGDRYTEYVSPTDMQSQMQAAQAGEEHLGMHLMRQSNGSFVIDAILHGSPAYNSGVLREGDIVRIVGTETLEGKTQEVVGKLMRGKPGDKVKITYEVGGKPQEVEIAWDAQSEETVMVDLLPGNIGYIRLPTFVEDGAIQAFVEALAALHEKANYDLRGLIFDLRNNSGGQFNHALTVSSLFIEQGTVTKSKTRTSRQVQVTDHTVIPFPAYTQAAMPAEMLAIFKSLQNVPLVVLVNGSSASASEVTTGALKDNGRAYVIGTKTFGKGVGYSMERLPNGGGLTITSLTYLTPKDFDLAGKGIVPDKVVENPRGEGAEDAQLKAAQDYLNAQNELRMKQLQDARTQAVQPHTKGGIPVVFTTVNATSVTVGLLVVCGVLVLIFVMAARRNRSNAIKDGAEPAGGDDCGCPH
jgi:carboxyl-terminal processing protease